MSVSKEKETPPTPVLLFTQSQYANYRKERGLTGTTPGAVHYALKGGRISFVPGTTLIDPEQADAQWRQNSDARVAKSASASASEANADYDAFRAKHEFYEAELSRIKFEERRASLVETDTVRRVLDEAGKIVSAGLDDIVSQIAPDIASETSISAVERILKTRFDRLRNDMADQIDKLDQTTFADEITPEDGTQTAG